MAFKHLEVKLPKVIQRNKALPNGGRGYETPDGKLYPSVTTILSIRKIGRAHVRTPVTSLSRMPSSA